MTTIKDLQQLLQQPASLQDWSYHKLEELLEQYPYCSGLRMLLVKKQKEEKHPLYQQSLILASVYSNDRSKLYGFLNTSLPNNTDKPTLGEQKQDTAEEEKKNDITVQLVSPPPVYHQVVSANPPARTITPTADTKTEDLTKVEQQQPIEDWLRSIEPARIEENEQVAKAKKNFKLPRIPVFEKDLLHFLDNAPSTKPSVAKKKKSKKTAKKKKINEQKTPEAKKTYTPEVTPLPAAKKTDQVKEEEDPFSLFFAQTAGLLKSLQAKGLREIETKPSTWEDNSTDEKEEVISETLATLLAAQGQKNKAIKMYEALSLKFPKKSRLFADKIVELQG